MIRLGKSGNYASSLGNENKQNIDQNIGKRKVAQRISKEYVKPCLQKKVSQAPTTCTIDEQVTQKQAQSHAQMLKATYSQQIAQDYSQSILDQISGKGLHLTNFLQNHMINSSLRAKMVDWMIQVLSSYKMTEESFFKSVSLMDAYLKKQTEALQTKDIHLLGVACMFSAMKYEQIHPLRLSLIAEKIARKKFTKKQIIDKESRVIYLLEFNLQFTTVYDLVKHLNYQIKLGLNNSMCKYLQQILTYLSKMCMFSSELIAQNVTVLASAVYFIGLKTLEQVAHDICPQELLDKVCQIVNINRDIVMEISRKVLDLAKNFSKTYPNLTNLKRFNRFQYQP